jgi:hypothetical protein
VQDADSSRIWPGTSSGGGGVRAPPGVVHVDR